MFEHDAVPVRVVTSAWLVATARGSMAFGGDTATATDFDLGSVAEVRERGAA